MEVVDSVVEDERGDAVLEGGGSGDEKAAQAVAEQDDLVGRDLAAGQRVVDDRGDHRFPVGAHDQFLFAQRGALSGAVEGQDVVSAAQRGGGDDEVGLLAGGVVSAVVDDGGARGAGVVDEEEVGRQGGVFIGDGHGLDRGVEKSGRSGEGVMLARGQQCHLRVGGRLLEQEVRGGAVVVRCPQQRFSGADAVSGSERLLADSRHPLRGGLPRLVPARLVTFPDVASCGENLAEIRPAVCSEPGGAQRLEGERLVLEQELHATNRWTNRRAVSATSAHPLSMVSEWPRPGIPTISVTASLRSCLR